MPLHYSLCVHHLQRLSTDGSTRTSPEVNLTTQKLHIKTIKHFEISTVARNGSCVGEIDRHISIFEKSITKQLLGQWQFCDLQDCLHDGLCNIEKWEKVMLSKKKSANYHFEHWENYV